MALCRFPFALVYAPLIRHPDRGGHGESCGTQQQFVTGARVRRNIVHELACTLR
jgi:hypothetical protein